MILTSDRLMLWFKIKDRWFGNHMIQLKRLFQTSPSQPARLMVRQYIERGESLEEIFDNFKNTTEIKICYVECGNLVDPNNSVIVGDFQVSQLKRYWFDFPKKIDFYTEPVTPFFEFEGVYKPVDNTPFEKYYTTR